MLAANGWASSSSNPACCFCGVWAPTGRGSGGRHVRVLTGLGILICRGQVLIGSLHSRPPRLQRFRRTALHAISQAGSPEPRVCLQTAQQRSVMPRTGRAVLAKFRECGHDTVGRD
jgi:hypothetical protein